MAGSYGAFTCSLGEPRPQMLSVPSKRVHPDGECSNETIQALEDIRVEETIEEENTSDPRWDALKKLK